jgi:hypothetical protein
MIFPHSNRLNNVKHIIAPKITCLYHIIWEASNIKQLITFISLLLTGRRRRRRIGRRETGRRGRGETGRRRERRGRGNRGRRRG